jgi:hypothetical protein
MNKKTKEIVIKMIESLFANSDYKISVLEDVITLSRDGWIKCFLLTCPYGEEEKPLVSGRVCVTMCSKTDNERNFPLLEDLKEFLETRLLKPKSTETVAESVVEADMEGCECA